MAISLIEALTIKEKLVTLLMVERDLSVHTIGIGSVGDSSDLSIEIYFDDVAKLGTESELLEIIPTNYHSKPIVFVFAPQAKATSATAGTFDPLGYFDPLIAGISISNRHLSSEFGTIGYFCKLSSSANSGYRPSILSNAHVLADLSLLDPYSKKAVCQPGTANTGSVDIAELTDYTPIDFSGLQSVPNYTDAAIASIGDGVSRKCAIPKLGAIGSLMHAQKLAVNTPCSKFGAKTFLTRGRIKAIRASTVINYNINGKDAWFDDQLIISGMNGSSFSAEGDSGSLIVRGHATKLLNNKLIAIGLLFANASEYEKTRTRRLPIFKLFKIVAQPDYTVANPISAVTSALDIELET